MPQDGDGSQGKHDGKFIIDGDGNRNRGHVPRLRCTDMQEPAFAVDSTVVAALQSADACALADRNEELLKGMPSPLVALQ